MKDKKIEQIKNALDNFNFKKTINSIETRRIEISNIESKYNVYIPDDFKEVLLNYEELFFDNEVRYTPIENSPCTSEDGRQAFDGFFGLKGSDNLAEQIECYLGRMPKSLIPIGECNGGNLICLGVDRDCLGKVYFWNHENEVEAKIMGGYINYKSEVNNYWDNLYLVAETLLDFINGLQISTTDQHINVEDVEIWLDDDLLND
ncbi:SMI1/KNR4 family protein [Oceanirhabdus sp. W0125-5]|uniref:SMI1/KNR4 family protein n=1 Tax=Oceanirhabdus sp. W0125-5 TaxID=2999116 RepID=UPI0022F30B86|nr:SMI1/KNR4 family protein [Oceanirhabdus sp. W0125-5]WBW96092.1 SMI1/KNR4 family protein [Oceanirhabdus sp. W0125-5]